MAKVTASIFADMLETVCLNIRTKKYEAASKKNLRKTQSEGGIGADTHTREKICFPAFRGGRDWKEATQH